MSTARDINAIQDYLVTQLNTITGAAKALRALYEGHTGEAVSFRITGDAATNAPVGYIHCASTEDELMYMGPGRWTRAKWVFALGSVGWGATKGDADEKAQDGLSAIAALFDADAARNFGGLCTFWLPGDPVSPRHYSDKTGDLCFTQYEVRMNVFTWFSAI